MAKEHFKFNFEPWMAEELIHRDDWEDWYEAMCEILPLWEVDTIERVAMFVAQCGHESGGFRVLSENLNYSAKALNTIFPKYFKRAGRDANEYHRQPEKIANVIYANRMDNGDADSGDGWRFRGGGILQLTGRYNYTKFGEAVDMSPEEAVDYVRTKKGALDSACWFWDTNGLNKYCDDQDIVGATKRINGGTIGLEDRTNRYKKAMAVMSGEVPAVSAAAPSATKGNVLKRGSTGSAVKEIQRLIGVSPADGIFGAGTEEAVKAWQKKNGLTADGVVGPATRAKM